MLSRLNNISKCSLPEIKPIQQSPIKSRVINAVEPQKVGCGILSVSPRRHGARKAEKRSLTKVHQIALDELMIESQSDSSMEELGLSRLGFHTPLRPL